MTTDPSKWFTPGPWKCAMNSHMVPEVKAGPITVATLWIPPVGSAFMNQRLISVAPELFETLRDYREAVLYAQDKHALMVALRQADDKARTLFSTVLGSLHD